MLFPTRLKQYCLNCYVEQNNDNEVIPLIFRLLPLWLMPRKIPNVFLSNQYQALITQSLKACGKLQINSIVI